MHVFKTLSCEFNFLKDNVLLKSLMYWNPVNNLYGDITDNEDNFWCDFLHGELFETL